MDKDTCFNEGCVQISRQKLVIAKQNENSISIA